MKEEFHTSLSNSRLGVKLKWAAWNKNDWSRSLIIKGLRIQLHKTVFPHYCLWKTSFSHFICIFSHRLAQKMEMFVLAEKGWEPRICWSSLQGLCDWGQTSQCLLLSSELVWSPAGVSQEQEFTQAATREILPPKARRQHLERRWGAMRPGLPPASLRNAAHVKDITIGAVGSFDSRMLLIHFKATEYWQPWMLLCLNIISRLQSRKSSKTQVAYWEVKSYLAYFKCFTSLRWGCY